MRQCRPPDIPVLGACVLPARRDGRGSACVIGTSNGESACVFTDVSRRRRIRMRIKRSRTPPSREEARMP
ncbi:hypothetical protein chiPu_0016165 [Chiloscyllium punctatum]|uniref:Uncharacterized protein n=1 Tax=Chiloscyllium punctatum TaxID=137246 RepID=A0A401T4W7_CHIPU|nr:hypothetical protein [Chiloscyllium punctatum]